MTRKATRARESLRKNGQQYITTSLNTFHTTFLTTPRVRLYRLPKQWPHWCKRLHIRKEGSFRGTDAWTLLIGCGRRWRINVHGEFQASDRHENFDRWGNSTAATFTIPKTYTELLLRTKFTTYDT